MRRRDFLAGMTAAAGLAAVAGPATAGAATVRSGAAQTTARAAASYPPADSLRALAAHVNLRIGMAVSPFDIATTTPDYNGVLKSQFSTATPENAMKWDAVEPEQGVFDFTDADEIVNFAEQNGMLVRGHTLLWHNQIPAWVTTGVSNGTISASQLKEFAFQRIQTEVSRYRGRIWQWDVANEFFTDTDPSMINPQDFWIQNLGEGIIAEAYRLVHQVDPHALLFYNDYNIAGEDGTNAKHDAAFAFVQGLLEQGVPIDGVGNQGHQDTQYGFSGTFQQDLAHFASLGLKVAITEADVRTFVNANQIPTDSLAPSAQSYYYTQMLYAALEVPQVISFTFWDESDNPNVSWVPGTFPGEGAATLWDANLNPKPQYFAVQQMLNLAAHAAPHHVATAPF